MNVFSSPPEPLILKPLHHTTGSETTLPPPSLNCAQETRAANASAASKWPIFLRRSLNLRCWSLQISLGEKQKRRKEHQFPAYNSLMVFEPPHLKTMRTSNWESFLRVVGVKIKNLKPPPRPLKFA